jgi:hypothetical protein
MHNKVLIAAAGFAGVRDAHTPSRSSRRESGGTVGGPAVVPAAPR